MSSAKNCTVVQGTKIKKCKDESIEQQRQINERDLRELAHYYGGWSELRKLINELEKEDNTAAAERYYSKPN
jgi:hypothetical protein